MHLLLQEVTLIASDQLDNVLDSVISNIEGLFTKI